MSILVVSCSLNPNSRSRVLAQELVDRISATGQAVEIVDLRNTPLPLCDGNACYADPAVIAMQERIASARAVVLAAPIYNFDLNAAAKNLVELTGPAWNDKIVGFVCAAGGRTSYMSVMNFANSLMLDFRCIILPRFVYAEENEVKDSRVTNPEVETRLDELAAQVVRFACGLDPS
jgi:FMN reductase